MQIGALSDVIRMSEGGEYKDDKDDIIQYLIREGWGPNDDQLLELTGFLNCGCSFERSYNYALFGNQSTF